MADAIGVEMLADQMMLIHIGDTVVAACQRHGRGWSSVVRGQQYETTNLDAVIDLVDTRIGKGGRR